MILKIKRGVKEWDCIEETLRATGRGLVIYPNLNPPFSPVHFWFDSVLSNPNPKCELFIWIRSIVVSFG